MIEFIAEHHKWLIGLLITTITLGSTLIYRKRNTDLAYISIEAEKAKKSSDRAKDIYGRINSLERSVTEGKGVIDHLEDRVCKISTICEGEITEIRQLTLLIGKLRQHIGRLEGAIGANKVSNEQDN